MKFCICLERKEKWNLMIKLGKVLWLYYIIFFFKKVKRRKIGGIECLFLIKRNYSLGKSVVFEIVNICFNEMFIMKVLVEIENMRFLREFFFKIIV